MEKKSLKKKKKLIEHFPTTSSAQLVLPPPPTVQFLLDPHLLPLFANAIYELSLSWITPSALVRMILV